MCQCCVELIICVVRIRAVHMCACCNYSLFVFIEQLVRLLFNPNTVVCEENVTDFVLINSEDQQNVYDVLSELCR